MLTQFSWQAAVIGGIGLAMSSTAMALQLMRDKGRNRNDARMAALSNTCAAPTPKIDCRSCHSLEGFSSRPMMNIRKTTPSSEKWRISSTSLINRWRFS